MTVKYREAYIKSHVLTLSREVVSFETTYILSYGYKTVVSNETAVTGPAVAVPPGLP
jgi:hypothetical protein